MRLSYPFAVENQAPKQKRMNPSMSAAYQDPPFCIGGQYGIIAVGEHRP